MIAGLPGVLKKASLTNALGNPHKGSILALAIQNSMGPSWPHGKSEGAERRLPLVGEGAAAVQGNAPCWEPPLVAQLPHVACRVPVGLPSVSEHHMSPHAALSSSSRSPVATADVGAARAVAQSPGLVAGHMAV